MEQHTEADKKATYRKWENLKTYLGRFERAAVAFSGGVDSVFLLKAAQEALGEQVLAVTVHLASFPEREKQEAAAFCRQEGIRHVVCTVDEFQIEGFAQNPKNRCYLCKKKLMGEILKAAREHGISDVLEGSNLDDTGDYRPGMQAVRELGLKSPLKEANLTKAEIRMLSREMGLATWDKPSFACLASRFVYGETITREKLRMTEKAEQRLMDLGFRQVRVRMHGEMARIEILPPDFEKMYQNDVREEISAYLKQLGFRYVTLDLEGYRTGSMNETRKNMAGNGIESEDGEKNETSGKTDTDAPA